MSTSIPIVALGARTPLGLSAHASAAAVRAGIRRVREHPFMIAGGQPLRCALDGALSPKALGGARLIELARSALSEALASLNGRLHPSIRVDVLLSVPETRPGFTDASAAWLARALPEGMFDSAPRPAELAARGHAGSLQAIREACARLEDGRSDVVAVVGVDSYIAPDTIDWLERSRQLAGEGNRSGFFPGEAAGCVVLAADRVRSHLGLEALATVRGAASARETRLIKGDEEVLGHGLTQAVLGAAKAASLRFPEEAIDEVYCDINGERYRADEWGFVLSRASHAMRRVGYRLPVVSWGDVGAASGVLGCVLAARAWARGYAAGPRALAWGSSEGGLRAAVVLEQARS